VLQVDFNGKAWERGQFAADGITANPWKSSASNSAPFDQPFYLIMNVSTDCSCCSIVLSSVTRQALQRSAHVIRVVLRTAVSVGCLNAARIA
jgi:hypothetical protein